MSTLNLAYAEEFVPNTINPLMCTHNLTYSLSAFVMFNNKIFCMKEKH